MVMSCMWMFLFTDHPFLRFSWKSFWVCCSVPCHGWCDDALCLVSVVILLSVYFPFLTKAGILQWLMEGQWWTFWLLEFCKEVTNVKFLQSQYRSHVASLCAATKCDVSACVMSGSWILIQDILRNEFEKKLKLPLCGNYVVYWWF